MSEVILDTITGKSTATTITIGSTPVVSASANSMTIRGEGSAQTSIQQGLIKSWFNFKLTDTTSLLDSFNVSTVTDNGTGRCTGSTTNNMSNSNYCISVIGDYDGGASVSPAGSATEHDNNSTSAYQFQSFRLTDDGYTDAQKAPASIIGDLA